MIKLKRHDRIRRAFFRLKINENKFGKSDYATEFYNILLCEEVAFSFEKNIGMGVICGSIMRQYCAVENKHGDRS